MDKYELILKALRGQIETGVFKENDRIPTEAELCREYQVSRITAMRAVKELQNAGLVRRVSGRGTFVCRRASLSLQPFHLLIPQLKVRYYSLMAEAFGSFFQAKNLPFSVVCGNYDPDYTAMLLRGIAENGSRGLAIVPPPDRREHQRLREQLATLAFPIVIGSRELEAFAAPQIVVDEEKTGFTAAAYLLERGHRRLLYLGPTEELPSASVMRYRGVLQALRRNPEAEIQTIERIDSVMLPRMKEIFASPHPPTAVISADDLLAAGAYDLLKALDLAPGHRIALIGLDGGLLGLALETPLTTVEFPGGTIGHESAATLYGIAAGRIAPADRPVTRYEGKLIVRASCGEGEKVYRHEYLRDLIRDCR